MNERIRELALKAGASYTTDQGWLNVNRNEILEHFAELIVKECVTVLNNRFMGDMNREDLEVRRCVVDIKKHFGMNNDALL